MTAELRKTPCCFYPWILPDVGPIYWNPYNGVVQCHNCGAAVDQRGVDPKAAEPSTFVKDVRAAINRYSLENGSDTPDWILAEYLDRCLNAFDFTVTAREKWYGRGPMPPPPTGNEIGDDEARVRGPLPQRLRAEP